MTKKFQVKKYDNKPSSKPTSNFKAELFGLLLGLLVGAVLTQEVVRLLDINNLVIFIITAWALCFLSVNFFVEVFNKWLR